MKNRCERVRGEGFIIRSMNTSLTTLFITKETLSSALSALKKSNAKLENVVDGQRKEVLISRV